MYTVGTVLKRREPLDEADELHIYNEVEVVAQSEVTSNAPSQWQGQAGLGVLLSPLVAFGEVVDRPYGEVERDYEVVSVPDYEEPVIEKPRVVAAKGLSPEEAFQKADANA
jgi:hypothetical protein